VKCIFPANDITSFIIPFIGPHECENVKKCPNQTFVLNDFNELTVNKREKGHQFDIKKNRFSASKINELCSSSAYTHIYCDQKNDSASISASSSFQKDSQSIEIEKKCTSTSSTPCESQFSNLTTGNIESSTISSESTLACPVPSAAIWWKTTHADQIQNRAIIGYSDGCIVVVRKLFTLFFAFHQFHLIIFRINEKLSLPR
jgi:hypothetical protein